MSKFLVDDTRPCWFVSSGNTSRFLRWFWSPFMKPYGVHVIPLSRYFRFCVEKPPVGRNYLCVCPNSSVFGDFTLTATYMAFIYRSNASEVTLKDVVKIDRYRTKTKYSKTRTMCIFLGMYCICDRPGTHFTKSVWANNWNFVKNIFFHSNYPIRSQTYTCHDSWAVVTCAKLWPDLIIIFKVRAT